MASLGKRLMLIAGTNQGIGFETAKSVLLGSSSFHVILGSRKLAMGEEAVQRLQAEAGIQGTVSSIQVDVTDDKSVEAAAKKVAADYGRLDILYREVLNTNVVGALSVTETFLGLLRKSSEPRLVFVSYSVGAITQAADPTSKYYCDNGFEYRPSKAAMNMLLVLYHNRLQKEGIKVLGTDLGLCATKSTGNAAALLSRGAATPTQGGDHVATVAKGDRGADVGHVLGEHGISPW
ncbi:hypothetical protein D0861_06844 [Hortaea werneckii]|uniref:Ketoreductase (KR) domain-containing protein n=1 Tax=Hortaea werneckii TaxID=91943 RepID=A0A3M7F8H9_HORWE|nr:hypothetical protein D0861_06844 [Hortaea werneckii]